MRPPKEHSSREPGQTTSGGKTEPEIEALVRLFYETVRSGEPSAFPSFVEHLPYDCLTYSILAADRQRTNWFRRALEPVVAGRSVIDIGTGDRGLLAIMSVELGATRAVGVDFNSSAIRNARRVVRSRCLDSRIELVVGDARRIRFRDKFDVCVAELVGHIAGAEGMREICASVGKVSMKPKAVYVPSKVQTVMAPCAVPQVAVHPAAMPLLSSYMSDMSNLAARRCIPIRNLIYNLPKATLLAYPQVVEDIIVGRPGPMRVERSTGEMTIRRHGMCNGVALWSRLMAKGVRPFSTFKGSSWAPVVVRFPDAGAIVKPEDRVLYEMEIEQEASMQTPSYSLALVIKRGRRALLSVAVQC